MESIVFPWLQTILQVASLRSVRYSSTPIIIFFISQVCLFGSSRATKLFWPSSHIYTFLDLHIMDQKMGQQREDNFKVPMFMAREPKKVGPPTRSSNKSSPEEWAEVGDAGHLGPRLQVAVRWHPPPPRHPHHRGPRNLKPTPSHPTGLLALITTAFSGAACLVCNPSCFHLLRQIQHHFSKCLYSCTARPLFRTFLQLNFIQRSRDRNFLGKIVSVYPRARQPTASVVATSVCAATRLRLRCRDRDSAIIHQNIWDIAFKY